MPCRFTSYTTSQRQNAPQCTQHHTEGTTTNTEFRPQKQGKRLAIRAKKRYNIIYAVRPNGRCVGGCSTWTGIRDSYLPNAAAQYFVFLMSTIANFVILCKREMKETEGLLFYELKDPGMVAQHHARVFCGIHFFAGQHSFAPAGIPSSSISRCRTSSPFSLWTADRSMPWLSCPIIFRGGRFTMATRVLPTRSSGL